MASVKGNGVYRYACTYDRKEANNRGGNFEALSARLNLLESNFILLLFAQTGSFDIEELKSISDQRSAITFWGGPNETLTFIQF